MPKSRRSSKTTQFKERTPTSTICKTRSQPNLITSQKLRRNRVDTNPTRWTLNLEKAWTSQQTVKTSISTLTLWQPKRRSWRVNLIWSRRQQLDSRTRILLQWRTTQSVKTRSRWSSRFRSTRRCPRVKPSSCSQGTSWPTPKSLALWTQLSSP